VGERERGMCGGKVARTFVWMEKNPFFGGNKRRGELAKPNSVSV
jgi:hypothetical protein